MKMISLTTKMIAENGWAVLMQANRPTEIPERKVQLAITMGCIPADALKTAEPTLEVEAEADNAPDQIKAAIQTLIATGNPKDFGKDGSAKVRAVEKILGYDISAADRDAAWDEIQEE